MQPGTRVKVKDGTYAGRQGTVKEPAEVIVLDGETTSRTYPDRRLEVITSTPTPTPAPAKVRWGSWLSQYAPPSDQADYDTYVSKVGKPQLIHFSSSFNYAFNTAGFTKVRDRGATAVFSWGPTGIPIRDITNGSHDTYLRTWAGAAKAFGSEIILKFAWEMNGTWEAWPYFSWLKENPTDYVAFWRHCHDIFTSVGASNVKWLFCPNVDPTSKFTAIESYWPGTAYVDLVGADGYNGGGNQTFEWLFGSTYDRLRGLSGGKPFIVGETSSTEATSPSKADWIRAMFASLPTRFPNLTGLVWFDKRESFQGHTDWNVDSSAASLAAFKAGIGGLA